MCGAFEGTSTGCIRDRCSSRIPSRFNVSWCIVLVERDWSHKVSWGAKYRKVYPLYSIGASWKLSDDVRPTSIQGMRLPLSLSYLMSGILIMSHLPWSVENSCAAHLPQSASCLNPLHLEVSHNPEVCRIMVPRVYTGILTRSVSRNHVMFGCGRLYFNNTVFFCLD